MLDSPVYVRPVFNVLRASVCALYRGGVRVNVRGGACRGEPDLFVHRDARAASTAARSGARRSGVGCGSGAQRKRSVAERNDAFARALRYDRLSAVRRQESLRRLQGRSSRRADRRIANDERRRLRDRRFRRNRHRHERDGQPGLLLRDDAARHPLRTGQREHAAFARDGAPLERARAARGAPS